LSQFKKYHSSGNLKFDNLGISQTLKLRILVENILSISLKLNFTPNTFGCYGLSKVLISSLRSVQSNPDPASFYALETIAKKRHQAWRGSARL